MRRHLGTQQTALDRPRGGMQRYDGPVRGYTHKLTCTYSRSGVEREEHGTLQFDHRATTDHNSTTFECLVQGSELDVGNHGLNAGVTSDGGVQESNFCTDSHVSNSGGSKSRARADIVYFHLETRDVWRCLASPQQHHDNQYVFQNGPIGPRKTDVQCSRTATLSVAGQNHTCACFSTDDTITTNQVLIVKMIMRPSRQSEIRVHNRKQYIRYRV